MNESLIYVFHGADLAIMADRTGKNLVSRINKVLSDRFPNTFSPVSYPTVMASIKRDGFYKVEVKDEKLDWFTHRYSISTVDL